jgi:hypothetical protein
MNNIRAIKKELRKAINMLYAAMEQKPNVTDRLMRMDGGIALTEMYLEKAKELLKIEMDNHDKSNNHE